jgi:hypothetical protein
MVVKVSDAPREGWYPDPEGALRLRWWDGTDWSDRFRPIPDAGQLSAGPAVPGVADDAADVWSQAGAVASQVPQSTAAVVNQVRMAAREEAHLAAQEFERRARALTGEIPPLISQYTSKFMRLVRTALVLGFVLLLAWFAYQLFVQKSLFDWLGDRIDNLTDNGSSVLLTVRALSRW